MGDFYHQRYRELNPGCQNDNDNCRESPPSPIPKLGIAALEDKNPSLLCPKGQFPINQELASHEDHCSSPGIGVNIQPKPVAH